MDSIGRRNNSLLKTRSLPIEIEKHLAVNHGDQGITAPGIVKGVLVAAARRIDTLHLKGEHVIHRPLL
jgi:hypothetical protein